MKKSLLTLGVLAFAGITLFTSCKDEDGSYNPGQSYMENGDLEKAKDQASQNLANEAVENELSLEAGTTVDGTITTVVQDAVTDATTGETTQTSTATDSATGEVTTTTTTAKATEDTATGTTTVNKTTESETKDALGNTTETQKTESATVVTTTEVEVSFPPLPPKRPKR